MIGTGQADTTRSNGLEKEILPVMFMNIGPFSAVTGDLELFGALLHRQSIVRQLYSVYPVMATPEEILFTVVFDIKRVDAVLHADLPTVKQFHELLIRSPGMLRHRDADPAVPFSAPPGHRIVEDIPAIDIIHIGRPQVSFERDRTGCIVECSTGKIPIDQVDGLEYRNIWVDTGFRRKKIENPIISPNHGRVGSILADDRVVELIDIFHERIRHIHGIGIDPGADNIDRIHHPDFLRDDDFLRAGIQQ